MDTTVEIESGSGGKRARGRPRKIIDENVIITKSAKGRPKKITSKSAIMDKKGRKKLRNVNFQTLFKKRKEKLRKFISVSDSIMKNVEEGRPEKIISESDCTGKRGRGRPRKNVSESEDDNKEKNLATATGTGSSSKKSGIGANSEDKHGTRRSKKTQEELLLHSRPIKCILSKCLETPTLDKMYEHLTQVHKVKTVTYNAWINGNVYLNNWNDLKKVNVKAFEYDGYIFLQHGIWDKDADKVYYWVSVIAEEEVAKRYKLEFLGVKWLRGGLISMDLYGQVVSVRDSHWPEVNYEEVDDEEGNQSSPVVSISKNLILRRSNREVNPEDGLSYAYAWTECFEIIESESTD